MVNIVALNQDDHLNLRVAQRFGREYGDAINQSRVFPTEYNELQREYAIFMRRSDAGIFQSFVLLGLDLHENLFLKDGTWDAHHVPAAQARGPFTIGVPLPQDQTENVEPLVQIDLDDARVVTEGGERMFLPHGGNAPYLEYVTTVLRNIYGGVQAEREFSALLQKLNLIAPVNVEITLTDCEHYSIPDLYAIDAEAFSALDGAGLETLHRAGYLAHCVWALSSSGNVNRLIERKRAVSAQG